eukprot:GDKI01034699.1.p1 GENE.GDKI01034699.1~~GDKI01034699.1.p1  ORF type:complete len:478 (-),score=97.77 GDKI01034699.1:829-2133(-)
MKCQVGSVSVARQKTDRGVSFADVKALQVAHSKASLEAAHGAPGTAADEHDNEATLSQFIRRIEYTEWSLLHLIGYSFLRSHPMARAAVQASLMPRLHRFCTVACQLLGSAMLIAAFVDTSPTEQPVVIVDLNIQIPIGGGPPVPVVVTLNAVLASIFAILLSQPFPILVTLMFGSAVTPFVEDRDIREECRQEVHDIQEALKKPLTAFDVLTETPAATVRAKAARLKRGAASGCLYPGVCVTDAYAAAWIRSVRVKRVVGYISAFCYIGFCLYFFWMFALVKGPQIVELLIDFVTGNIMQLITQQGIVPLAKAIALALLIKLMVYTPLLDPIVNAFPRLVDFRGFRVAQTGKAQMTEGGDFQASQGPGTMTGQEDGGVNMEHNMHQRRTSAIGVGQAGSNGVGTAGNVGDEELDRLFDDMFGLYNLPAQTIAG